MAREFARKFYNSSEWQRCRERYIQLMPKYKRGLCELCYKDGTHVRGEELHHKIFLTPNNINDRSITLDHDNLILLCRECHKKIHVKRREKKYEFDKDGNIIPVNKKI